MKKVYIVFDVEFEGGNDCYFTNRKVEAVFQSREEAEAYAVAMDWGDGEVEEWEVK